MLSIEARAFIQKVLRSSDKSGEELRRAYLGERPDKPDEQKRYDTRYQALRRAIDSMIEDGTIETPKYHLSGEFAEENYLRKSLQHFKASDDPVRQQFLMKQIEAECRKRDAILTPGILVFLKSTLRYKSPEIRKLAISSVSYMASKFDESKRLDLSLLKRLRTDYSSKLVEIAKKDSSLDVRNEAFQVLLMLGTWTTISVIEQIVTQWPKEEFKQIKSTLLIDLFIPYDASAFSKNRLLRDHKEKLRNVLTEIRLGNKDQIAQERAEVLLWKLQYGYKSTMPGGREETLE